MNTNIPSWWYTKIKVPIFKEFRTIFRFTIHKKMFQTKKEIE
jgi:hypothetical protein